MAYFLRSLAAVGGTAALVCSHVPAHAGEEILFGEPPDWVVGFDAAAPGDFTSDLPVHVQLSDFQTRLERDAVIHYIALDLEFRTPQGLSAGDISINWRPEFDDLTVHHVIIRRGDEEIDVLAEGQTFNVLRREQNLDAAMLNGVLTANMFPAGLEVGDVLSIAYTLEQSNPVLEDLPEAALGPLNGIVDQSHVRLSWPQDLDLTVRASDDLPELERGRRRGYDYAALTMGVSEPLIVPASAPARYQFFRMFEASPYQSWGELAGLFVPLYEEASQIADSGPLRDELEEIRNSAQDPVERAELALALVQDKVRYVALAMGEGGLVPADTASTWARRFGDCKAKTALLLGFLHELGIEAEPIVVSSYAGDVLPYRLPMVAAFDHVLVRAHIGGETYFLDGTRTGDTSLAKLAVPYFGWGLPILAGGADLVEIVPDPLTIPDEETIVRMDASAGLHAPAPTEIVQTFRGDTAIAFNNSLMQLAGQARQQALEGYWRDQYDYVTPDNVDVQFDHDAGELHLTLTGTAEMDWSYNSFEPQDMRVGYSPDFTRATGPASDAPFAVPYPFFNRTTHIVTLPEGFTAQQIDGENVEQVVAGLEYKRDLSLADNVFTATRSTRSLVPEFAFAEAAEAEPVLEGLWEKRVFLDIPVGYRLSDTEVASMAEAGSEDPQYLIDQGIELIDAAEWDAALSVLDKVVDIAPDNQWGWANRALVHANLGDDAAMEADIVRALEIDPHNEVVFNARGLAAARSGDMAAALEAFDKSIEYADNPVWPLQQRAAVYASEGEYALALADARRLIALQPGNAAHQLMAGTMLVQLDRPAALRDHVEAMLAQFPDNEVLTSLASDLYLNAGMEAEAQAMLARTIEDGESPFALIVSAGRRPVEETELKLAELEQALAIVPDFLPALLMRGETLWMEYELERALADADRVIELSPDREDGYNLKYKVLLDMEREDEALALVDGMAERRSDDANGLAQVASSYRELGADSKAKAAATRAYELAPGDEMVRRVYEYIVEGVAPIVSVGS